MRLIRSYIINEVVLLPSHHYILNVFLIKNITQNLYSKTYSCKHFKLCFPIFLKHQNDSKWSHSFLNKPSACCYGPR